MSNLETAIRPGILPPDPGFECRILSAELSLGGTADLPKICGYAAVFNQLSIDLGGWFEMIEPGAFHAKLVSTDDILATSNSHDVQGAVIGRRSNATLAIREDAKGLYVEIEPSNTSIGRDAIELVRRRDYDGMSFSFKKGMAKDRWDRRGGKNVRILTEIPLTEVTITPMPAYAGTSAQLLGVSARSTPRYVMDRATQRAHNLIKIAEAEIAPSIQAQAAQQRLYRARVRLAEVEAQH